MLNLRRCMPAVMFILLGWLAVRTAAAQPFSCNTSAVPRQVRAEGLTELVGDMTLTCTGGVAAQSLTANLAIVANTNITSKILSNDRSEALLTIGHPPYTPATLYQGQMSGNNSVVFSGVSITMPGPKVTLTLTFRNVRVNAMMLGVGSPVIMLVTIAGPYPVSISNPQQTVAMTQTGLSFEVRKTDDSAFAVPDLVSSPGNNVSLLTGGDYPTDGTPGGRSFNLKFKEGFSSSFRTEAQEDGYNDPKWPSPLNKEAGLATHGARLQAHFTGIPKGVTLFVTRLPVSSGTSSTVQAQCTLQPTGPMKSCPQNATADGGLYKVPSSGEVYWEIMASSLMGVESVSFGVAVAFQPMAVSGTLTANVLGTFAPISIVGTASKTEDVPRFGSSGTAIPAFTLRDPRTVLAFQYVTSRPGYDTSFAVTNMAKDNPIYSTAGQTGHCKAYFYGVNPPLIPPLALTSPNPIPPGRLWEWTMSDSFPKSKVFEGYVLVDCPFQYAHGFALISSLGLFGADRFATSYQALVLPDRTRVPDPASTSVAGSGEQLFK